MFANRSEAKRAPRLEAIERYLESHPRHGHPCAGRV